MRTMKSVLAVVGMAVAVSAGAFAAQTCPATGGPCCMAPDEGWITLFDGSNLDQWQNARNPEAENKWFIEDGCMTNKEHANNIGTKESFKNFDLKLEYKIVAKGNSGVYLRGRVEVQILDSHGKEHPGKGDDGAIYDKFVPLVNASNQAGEWNTLVLTYKDDVLTAKLNGNVIHDKQQIGEVTGGALPGGVNEAGPVMLQGDHGKIWFRNIMIRPCKAQ